MTYITTVTDRADPDRRLIRRPRADVLARAMAFRRRAETADSVTLFLRDWTGCSTISAVLDCRKPSGQDAPDDAYFFAADERFMFRGGRLVGDTGALARTKLWLIERHLPKEVRVLLARTDTPFGAAMEGRKMRRQCVHSELTFAARQEAGPGLRFRPLDTFYMLSSVIHLEGVAVGYVCEEFPFRLLDGVV